MELRHLRYFVTVAEALSFRKAAEKLHISQPPLSTQIRDLEYELGTDLFAREKRSIRLTEAGAVFLVSARKILKDSQKAKSDAQLAAAGRVGRLSLRFLSSAVTGILQKLVLHFKETCPLVDLDLQQSNSQAILKDVQEGNLDIGIVRIPFNVPDDIMAITVSRDSYYVALPVRHRLVKKKWLMPKDLKDEKLILHPRHTSLGWVEDIFSLFARQNVVPEIAQEALEQLTIAGLVAAGMGYSIVPECMTKIRIPGIAHVPLRGGHNRAGMAVVSRKSPGPVAALFIKEVAQKFGLR